MYHFSQTIKISGYIDSIKSSTVDSRYSDTAGIREMYQYIQIIDITSIDLYRLVMVSIQILYCSVISRISLEQTS